MHAFRSSPFALVADETSAACWAGRKSALVQLRKLCRTWASRPDSTLDLVWSNLGAGKTHALMHLRHLLRSEFACDQGCIVLYAEVPDQCTRFLELYRRLTASLELSELTQLNTEPTPPDVTPRIIRACRAIEHGNETERRLAHEWLLGGRPNLRELKAITNIDARIENDQDAERITQGILKLAARHGKRVVMLIDEFQRLGHLGKRTRETLLSHLRALFSGQSTYFSLVGAVGSRIEKTAIDLLSPELRTIMGMRPTISLPEMSMEEAKTFLLQRLAWFRPDGYDGTPEHPFTAEQIELVLAYLMDTAKVPLIPRTVLQVFGIVCDEVQEQDAPITSAELLQLLDSLRWGDLTQE